MLGSNLLTWTTKGLIECKDKTCYDLYRIENHDNIKHRFCCINGNFSYDFRTVFGAFLPSW